MEGFKTTFFTLNNLGEAKYNKNDRDILMDLLAGNFYSHDSLFVARIA